MPTATFQPGDVVIHPRRPEWGEGVIESAMKSTHQGQTGQKLTVRFANHGRVTINTAVVPLHPRGERGGGAGRPASEDASTPMSQDTSGKGWLDAIASHGQNPIDALIALPEALTDPFSSLRQRLAATLDTFRFSTAARDLLDWGVAQTGLADPLSQFTRQELEQAFARFERDRDDHLNSLVTQLKREGQVELARELGERCQHPAAKRAMDRALRR